jgi:SAM-dependent methyltransferase
METGTSHPASGNAAAPDFDQLARVYRWLEYFTFGPFLWRCRNRFLAQLADCRRALILGDGDGRFTARLLREYPKIRVHAVDASPRMIEALRQACRRDDARLTTEVADLRSWKPADSSAFDLVATHFFLDCLSTEEIAALAGRLRPAIAARALWLVSDFAVSSTLFGRIVAAPLIAALYRTFRLLTGLRQQSLPDHNSALRASGWSLRNEDGRLSGLLLSQLWWYQPEDSESHWPADSST